MKKFILLISVLILTISGVAYIASGSTTLETVHDFGVGNQTPNGELVFLSFIIGIIVLCALEKGLRYWFYYR